MSFACCHNVYEFIYLSALVFLKDAVFMRSCATTAYSNMSFFSFAETMSLKVRGLINTYHLGLDVSKSLPWCLLSSCGLLLCCYHQLQIETEIHKIKLCHSWAYTQKAQYFTAGLFLYSWLCNYFYRVLTYCGGIVELGHI